MAVDRFALVVFAFLLLFSVELSLVLLCFANTAGMRAVIGSLEMHHAVQACE